MAQIYGIGNEPGWILFKWFRQKMVVMRRVGVNKKTCSFRTAFVDKR